MKYSHAQKQKMNTEKLRFVIYFTTSMEFYCFQDINNVSLVYTIYNIFNGLSSFKCNGTLDRLTQKASYIFPSGNGPFTKINKLPRKK